VADNFEVGGSGTQTINSECWWGTYGTACGAEPPATGDHFQVTYYANTGGLPGAVMAGPYVQGTTLTVNRRNICDSGSLSSSEYTSTHAPFTVNAGDCYFIEIINALSGTATWFWSHSDAVVDGISVADTLSDGYTADEQGMGMAGDRAFCITTNLDFSLSTCTPFPPPPPPCPNDPANGQPRDAADNVGGYSSSPGSVGGNATGINQQLADSFSLSTGGAITNVCFWGFWQNFANAQVAGPTDQGVDITYYNTNLGHPGTQIASFRVGRDAGVVLHQNAENYNVTHPAVNVQPNTCYWISVSYQANSGNPARAFRWLWGTTTAGSVGDNFIQFRNPNTTPPGAWAQAQFGAPNTLFSNMSYVLNIGPAVMPNCNPTTGACCVNNVCSQMTQTACAAAGGFFSGVGVACNANSCPGRDPRG
jgi:hypothetical protein